MKEKFDRNLPHVNIGEIGGNSNETPEEKIARLETTKMKLDGAPIDPTLKNDLIGIIHEL